MRPTDPPGLTETDPQEFNEIQRFVRDASPAGWLECAEELRDSAEVLSQNGEQSRQLEVRVDQKSDPVNRPVHIRGH